MDELIARLEKAAEGSRDLDAFIDIEAVDPLVMTDGGDYQGKRPVVREPASKAFANWQDTWANAADLMNSPHFSTSLDAALPGENIVKCWVDFQTGGWIAVHDKGGGPDGRFTGSARTEPLARRIAALKGMANV